MNKIWIKSIGLIVVLFSLTACPHAKLTSLFLRNYTDSAVVLKLTGAEEALFEKEKTATFLPKTLHKCKLKIGACAEGDTLPIEMNGKSHTIIIPAKSTGEIIFPMYKIVKLSSNLTIETEVNGVKRNYFSNQFDELFRSKKEVFYIDFKDEN